MKYIVVFILFVIFPTGFAANVQNTEQTTTACSFITEFEQMVRGCIEENEKNCVFGLGAGLNMPEDVQDIIHGYGNFLRI